jgi:hypothetical protein
MATPAPAPQSPTAPPSAPIRRPLNLDWGNWFYGMWLAVASGLSTAGLVSCAQYLQNKDEHNISHQEFWVSFGMIVAITSGKDFFLYLSQNPAPKIITQQSTVSAIQQSTPAGTITATQTQVTTTTTTEEPK